jgi:opacity protein-like surface antigen
MLHDCCIELQTTEGIIMKKILLPLIAACCLAPVAAFAGQQHPLVTDQAEVVAPAKYEAETAVEYHSNGGYSAFVIQETVTAGMIPKLDAFIAVPFMNVKQDIPGASSESGLGDFTIGAKFNFLNVDKTTVSVKPFILLPVGEYNKGFGEGGFGFGANLIASLELDKQITVDGNLVIRHQNSKNDSYNEFGISVAGKLQATRDLKGVAELALLSGSRTDAFVTAGAIFAVQKNLDIDGGLRLGLSHASDDYALLAGATFKF